MANILNFLKILSGPLLFTVLQFLGKPLSMSAAAFSILCVTIWMAIWWITEAVPIAVTALLPIVLFPLTGALGIEATTAAYGHKFVFLYLGGFILAVAIEKWGLHKRIALTVIHIIGSDINKIILGFMIATALLSMWISNTATSVMMLPIGTAIISQMQNNSNSAKNENQVFGKALMLAIAYSASIGGMATLIGTPPNLVFAGIVQQLYGVEITFTEWIIVGLPVSVLLLLICWKYLTGFAFKVKQKEFPGGEKEISRLLRALGKTTVQEKRVLSIFIITALCWITRAFVLEKILPAIDDTIIAIAAAVTLFVVPSGKKGEKLIAWEEAVKIPWGIILLFGGGMALAKGFGDSGLAQWIGDQLINLEHLPLFLLVLILVTAVNFLTEVTSNLATTAMLLPILAPMAMGLEIHPYILLISATLAASCAFMLPVATPPNAVVFGSGYLHIPDMIKTGLWMNLFSIIIITLLTYFILPVLWNFDPHAIPEIFKLKV